MMSSRLNRTLFAVSATLIVIGTVAMALALPDGDPQTKAPGQPPYGIAARVPWTSSHISGSPEPPPYITRQAFPLLRFKTPLDIAFAPDGKRVFVVEQYGKIYSFPNDESCKTPDLLVDLGPIIHGWEKLPFCAGLDSIYGFCFDPHFAQNHYVYICYALAFKPPQGHARLTREDEQGTRLSRFSVVGDQPPRIDDKSEQILLSWYAGGHNGGCIKFGPDGYLYISSGDGGDPDPPDAFNTGQDISDLLSSILRIDVSHPAGDKPYSIPADNPFIHTPGARPEVYAYGLRNPWRMNFDARTGNLWVADVGWELWESVHCVKSGGNYGWSIMEGPNPVHPLANLGPTPISAPAVSLSHAEAGSITGGIVYRGKKFPELAGQYIFGDWQTRRIWAAKVEGDQSDKLGPHRTIAETDQKIVAFGLDPDGEPIIVDHGGGGLWRLARNDQANDPSKFPRKLSETGLFVSTKAQVPAPGVMPFSINAPQWLDGATARRWIAIPGSASMSWGKGVWNEDKPAWPKDSVLVRTLSMPAKPGANATPEPLETQILHFDGKQWVGYSYAWNEQHTDADLVAGEGDERQIAAPDPSAPGGIARMQWHFGSRAQCMTCHNIFSDYVLAFTDDQLDRQEKFAEGVDNQVHTFEHLGLLLAPLPPNAWEPPITEKLTLTDPYDATADLNERARSYLHVNCSHCHRFGGGGTALFDVRKQVSPDKLNLINIPPNLGNFGIDDAKLACAGDPARSVLLYRMAKLGSGRMPRIASDRVDLAGVSLMQQWIAGLADHARAPPTDPATGKLIAGHRANLKLLENPATSAAEASAAIDRLLSSTGGAMELLCDLQVGKLSAAAGSMATSKGIAAAQPMVRDLFRRFDPRDQQIARLGPNVNPAKLLALRGDPARGRKIFFEFGGTGLCARCHIIDRKGTEYGPDLSHIATKYNRADLLDNILNPSKTIAPGYATYVVRTKNGDTFSGLLVKKTDQEFVIKDAQLKEIHIPQVDIQKTVAQSVSAMPEGLLGDLEAQQAADLLEFVASLK